MNHYFSIPNIIHILNEKRKKNYCQKWKRGNAIHKIEE